MRLPSGRLGFVGELGAVGGLRAGRAQLPLEILRLEFRLDLVPRAGQPLLELVDVFRENYRLEQLGMRL